MKVLERANPEVGKFFDVILFDADTQRTIYLIGPYKGRLQYVKVFIKKMLRRGYRVLYLQPCPQVLNHSTPQWLGEAIDEAVTMIRSDMKRSIGESSLVGMSLGSYLGLNIQLKVPFKKFVVVAGGAPLRGVFQSAKLFKGLRRAVGKDKKKKALLDASWRPYDEAYKGCDLSHSTTLLINSNNDRVIRAQQLEKFLESYKKTGVRIINLQKGRLNHTLQALSLNFRADQVDKFLHD